MGRNKQTVENAYDIGVQKGNNIASTNGLTEFETTTHYKCHHRLGIA